VAKPDKGIFEVVERELRVPPRLCPRGDHPLNDVVGAKQTGWTLCGSAATALSFRPTTMSVPTS
jgi:FMN phosphatase YigB (HAD superfamily)